LAVKGNHKTLYNDIKNYFAEKVFLIKIKEKGSKIFMRLSWILRTKG